MSGRDDQAAQTTQTGRRVFPWASYLFGMVVAAPVFTFLALSVMSTTSGKSLLEFSIDPVLVFAKLPLFGAFLGFVLVLLCNLGWACRKSGNAGPGEAPR